MTNLLQIGKRLVQMAVRPLWHHGLFLLTMAALALVTAVAVELPKRHQGFFALQGCIDLYALALLLQALPRKWSAVCKTLIGVLAYSLSLIEIYLFFRFHLIFSPTMLNLLFETNGGEAREFLLGVARSGQLWKAVACVLPIALAQGFFLWGWPLLKRKFGGLFSPTLRSRWQQAVGGFRWGLLLVLLGGCLLLGAADWVGEKRKMLQYFSNRATRKAEAVPMNTFYSSPYRLVHALHFLRIARGETEQLMERMSHLRVDSCAATCPNIVLIIGESYNKHHAGLYGYSLNTTPHLSRLAKSGSLIAFSDVVSPWNVTSQAFKSFLSTQSADQGGAWTEGVLFPAVFRKAGYRVCFATNQFYRSASQGVIDFNGSFFLNDERMDSLCFDHRNRMRSRGDSTLVSLLTRYVPTERNLYLLHLYGQHMEYDQRYPKGKARFSESDIQRPDLSLRERRIVAHYDNATLHNDECVARILAHFRKQDALVLYFSDHGEEVYDGQAGQYGRNHSPRPSAATLWAEFEVPFMFWTTPTFRRRHPEIVRAIKAAQHRPFSTDDLPHLLFGLAGIQTPYYQPQRDLLSPHFTPQRRWIKESVDYDAVMQGWKRP